MQIHEITKLPVNEGIASALGSIVGGARAGASALGQKLGGSGAFSAAMKDPVRQQQIKMLADKTYGAWKTYEKDLLRTNPDARETGMYEQALMAFVSKNLLGGQYLPNVINQAQIKTLVKQLSGPDAIEPATSQQQTITIGGQKLDPKNPEHAKIIATMQSQGKLEEASLPDAIKGNIQQWKDTFKGSKTAPAATAPSPPATNKPTVTNPPASAPLSPQKEKDLWLKLIQQAAIATTQAPGTQAQSGTKPSAKQTPGSTSGAGDARSYQQQFTQSMDSAVVKGLPIFGNTAVKNIGDNTVRGTGNPVADALLLMAGFRGI